VSINSFASIIEKHFRNNGGWLRLRGEMAVYYWPRVAGDDIAGKVEAIRYRDGYLYLQTDNPALAHQLSFLSLDIIKKYRKMFGDGIVKGIKIKIGALNEISKIRQSAPDVILQNEEKAEISACAQTIADPLLADTFGHFMEIMYLIRKRREISGGKGCRSCGIIIEPEFEYCPCCERQVREEIDAYLKYIEKNKHTTKMVNQETLLLRNIYGLNIPHNESEG
jgi:hypothetical protein